MSTRSPEARPPLLLVGASYLARGLHRAGRWTASWMGPLLVGMARAIGGVAVHTSLGFARLGWWHRTPIVGLIMRVLWWGSLFAFLEAGRGVLDTTRRIDVDQTLLLSLLGIAMCAAVVALSRARRLRWAAIVLGTAHAAAYVLLSSLTSAT